MSPCLHLAVLEASYDSDLVNEVRDLPNGERQLRYAELIAEKIPADVDEASWTDEADLLEALPDDADETIRSLAGIEAYPNLKSLYLRESEVDDLGPLAALPDLELLWLGVTSGADLTPVLSSEPDSPLWDRRGIIGT